MEAFRIQLDGELDDRDQPAGYLGDYDFEFRPPNGPVLAFDRIVGAGAGAAEVNSWPMVISEVPVELAAPLASADPAEIWPVIEEARRATILDTELALLRSLRGANRPEVAAFQAGLYLAAEAIVERWGCRWASAGLAVLQGQEYYTAVLAGDRPVDSSSGFQFEDVLDLAEIALGRPLRLPDGATSRSTCRDPAPHLAEGFDQSSFRSTFGVAVEEWDRLPWRWEGWRVRATSPAGLRDLVFIANRPWQDGLVQTAQSIAHCVRCADATPLGLPEVVFPELRRPGRRMPPFFYSRTRTRPR
ncbi:MAG: hypothetical protein KF727_11930 [Microbacteriaceae bacterium]|nr:hypothetical protein [Microbacteriaceae bacterium]